MGTRAGAGRVWIGCSGWQYASWRGHFYPKRLPPSGWLEYYTSHFATVEVNGTFYKLPEAGTFSDWRKRTPPGFVIAVKASRYLTHLKRLREPGPPLSRLFSRVAHLGPRLGPILFQLPPMLPYDLERLRTFLAALRARSLRHFRARSARRRFVLEFRHPSWYREETFALLRRARVALCLHDMAGSGISEISPEPFVYVRFHGTSGRYAGGYSEAALEVWTRRIAAWAGAGHDVYAYFNNDPRATAAFNALTLQSLCGRRQPRGRVA